jgi:hypothetical protein
MRIQFPFKILVAVTIVPLLLASQAGHAQTAQTSATAANTPANAATGTQAQQDPVGPAHADGKAGKSSRPWFNERNEDEPDLRSVPR